MEQATITKWIKGLRSSDQEAATRLWDHYFQRLVDEARRSLGKVPTRTFNEEDVALSAFASFCRGVSTGKFDRVGNRDDLWRLLVVITRGKVIDQKRRDGRQKRGSGTTRGESVFLRGTPEQQRRGLDAVVGNTLDPEFLSAVGEEYQRLLSLLRNDTLRSIAISRMEGYSIEEIAQKMEVSVRTVERKIHLIRQRWMNEILPENS